MQIQSLIIPVSNEDLLLKVYLEKQNLTLREGSKLKQCVYIESSSGFFKEVVKSRLIMVFKHHDDYIDIQGFGKPLTVTQVAEQLGSIYHKEIKITFHSDTPLDSRQSFPYI
tara:strand:+ start:228 stop:563 length:336 start_codon:yes stop_codon:yes gene_type:complete